MNEHTRRLTGQVSYRDFSPRAQGSTREPDLRGRLDREKEHKEEHTKERKREHEQQHPHEHQQPSGSRRRRKRKRSAWRKLTPPKPRLSTKARREKHGLPEPPRKIPDFDYGSALGLLKKVWCAAFRGSANDRIRVRNHLARVLWIFDHMQRSGPLWVYSLHLTKPHDRSDLKAARQRIRALPEFAAMTWVVFKQRGKKNGRPHHHCLLLSHERFLPKDLETLAYNAVGRCAGVKLRWVYRYSPRKNVRDKKIKHCWPDLCDKGKREALEAALSYYVLELFVRRGGRGVEFLNCPPRPRGLGRLVVLRLALVLGLDPFKKRQ